MLSLHNSANFCLGFGLRSPVIDTKDNPHEAAKQGQVALDLCWRLEGAADDLAWKTAEIVDQFQKERMTHTPIKVLYQLCYL